MLRVKYRRASVCHCRGRSATHRANNINAEYDKLTIDIDPSVCVLLAEPLQLRMFRSYI